MPCDTALSPDDGAAALVVPANPTATLLPSVDPVAGLSVAGEGPFRCMGKLWRGFDERVDWLGADLGSGGNAVSSVGFVLGFAGSALSFMTTVWWDADEAPVACVSFFAAEAAAAARAFRASRFLAPLPIPLIGERRAWVG